MSGPEVPPLHRLLQRQLRRLGLQSGVVPDAQGWDALLARISRTYAETDDERYLMERSQALATREMEALNEALSRARDAAEAMAQVKSGFLANMSHEIRTPLNAVLGMTHLALQAQPTPQQRGYLEKIHQAGQHLLGIINDILDFSKIEAGRMTVEHVAFELDQVLEAALAMVIDQATRKGLEVTLEVDAQVPPRLRGDPQRLRQILLNFLNNAVKFTAAGRITVRVGLATAGLAGGSEAGGTPDPSAASPVAGATRASRVRVEVSDTGIGIEPAQLPRLFQSFEQADATTTRRYGGTGLGLAISRRLAEMLGGEVGVHSEPQRGSTFWFTFPAEPAPEDVEDAPASSRVEAHRVLVVDDYPAARLRLVLMLGKLGLKAHGVASGAAALKALRDAEAAGQPYEAVYLDVLMPEMDGMATAHEVARLPLAAAPRIVFVTGLEIDAGEVLGRVPSAVDVLSKPVASIALAESVGRLFAGAPVLRPDPVSSGDADAAPESLRSIAGARVLVVEDNELNQQVASELLARLGLTVELAGHGRAALDRVLAPGGLPFDLVLMDTQMPEMDGLEATRRLRQTPQGAALPIVAMTANVLPEDRRRCLDAGMNDHLPKPVDPEQLRACLLRWIPARRADAAATWPQLSAAIPVLPWPTLDGLDAETGLRRCGGQLPFYRRMLELFVRRWATLPATLAEMLHRQDWDALQRTAHSFKGVCGTVGAVDLQDLAWQVENAARNVRSSGGGHGDALGEALDRLAADVDVFVPALREALGMAPGVDVAVPLPARTLEPSELERIRRLSQQVLQLLQSSEVAAIRLVETDQPLFQAWLGPGFPALERALRDYDFETATLLLQAAVDADGQDG